MDENTNPNRRSILQSLGASSLALGGMGTLSNTVSAAEQSDLQIAEVTGYKATYLRLKARYSDEYESLVRQMDDVQHAHFAGVYERREDDEKVYIVSFFIGNQSDSWTQNNEDVAIAIDSEYNVLNGKAVRVTTSRTMAASHDFTVYSASGGEVSKSTHSSKNSKVNNGDVRTLDSKCETCKSLYDVVCGGPGCNIGFATICYLVRGGLAGAWCGALAGDICSFVDKNSCEAGLNKVVCQILGYCSTSPGEDPCERFPGGVDSPHCDA